MSISNQTELDLIKYMFNATAAPWAATANFWVSLHTANPDEAGTAQSSEISYTGYARASAARTTSGWTAANPTSNVLALATGAMTAGTGGTVTHVGVVDSASGAGNLIASGACTPNIVVTNGVTPSFAAGAVTFGLD